VLQAMPDEPVDAIGFSLGAMTLLRVAVQHPQRFRRLVLAGIGATLFDDDTTGTQRIIDALEGNAPPDDNIARLFTSYAHQPGNDVLALTAVMKRPRGTPFDAQLVAGATCPTLVIIGDRDFAGPGDPLADALPDGRLVTLRNVDHFATPESFGFIDAALEFIDAVPA
jgi:pimeloyl-ACP methyl ester carboxylesterase